MIEPGHHELDVLLTILSACALLVQLHYLRPVFRRHLRASVSAGFRTCGWFVFTVFYAFNLVAYGDIPVTVTGACGVMLLALAEIAVTITEGKP